MGIRAPESINFVRSPKPHGVWPSSEGAKYYTLWLKRQLGDGRAQQVLSVNYPQGPSGLNEWHIETSTDLRAGNLPPFVEGEYVIGVQAVKDLSRIDGISSVIETPFHLDKACATYLQQFAGKRLVLPKDLTDLGSFEQIIAAESKNGNYSNGSKAKNVGPAIIVEVTDNGTEEKSGVCVENSHRNGNGHGNNGQRFVEPAVLATVSNDSKNVLLLNESGTETSTPTKGNEMEGKHTESPKDNVTHTEAPPVIGPALSESPETKTPQQAEPAPEPAEAVGADPGCLPDAGEQADTQNSDSKNIGNDEDTSSIVDPPSDQTAPSPEKPSGESTGAGDPAAPTDVGSANPPNGDSILLIMKQINQFRKDLLSIFGEKTKIFAQSLEKFFRRVTNAVDTRVRTVEGKINKLVASQQQADNARDIITAEIVSLHHRTTKTDSIQDNLVLEVGELKSRLNSAEGLLRGRAVTSPDPTEYQRIRENDTAFLGEMSNVFDELIAKVDEIGDQPLDNNQQ